MTAQELMGRLREWPYGEVYFESDAGRVSVTRYEAVPTGIAGRRDIVLRGKAVVVEPTAVAALEPEPEPALTVEPAPEPTKKGRKQ